MGKPDQLRTAHLREMKTPTLIVQGTRDPFGPRKEVAAFAFKRLSRSHTTIQFLLLLVAAISASNGFHCVISA